MWTRVLRGVDQAQRDYMHHRAALATLRAYWTQSMPPSASTLPPPARIGTRYEVVAELGRGGMGGVYRVRDAARGSEVALKQLLVPQDSAKAREVAALFEREFHTLAQLSHPSVIEVYDYGVDALGPYYTMELLDGGDLSERAPVPYREACALLASVCSSLSLLHSRRLVHRDISPRNVRCTKSGNAKLIDFGAMVPMGPSSQAVGTPACIAPEVLHQLPLDARSDLFSLGATLYYALTGRTPFGARNFADLREAWGRVPLPPSQLVDDIPDAVDALVRSLLRIDPAQRPRSAFEVMQRLCAIAGIEQAEPADIAQAYLSSPTLVGRDRQQQEFRSRVQRAAEGHGGGLSVEGASGLGRSRFLDACVLDAKTASATVLRLAGATASRVPFSGAQRLAEQLLEESGELAVRCARETGALAALFAQPSKPKAPPQLLAAGALTAERHVLQDAFVSWFRCVGQNQLLVLAVDDAERVDEATLAMLAGVGHVADQLRVLLLLGVRTPIERGTIHALDVLRSQCTALVLPSLTRAETEQLFSSVFGGAPNLAMVSERIHDIAQGSPRESMALAQHLLDRQRLRYADGSWILPAELTVTDLPADAEEALRMRVNALPPLARRLAELQALSFPGGWNRADYAELAGPEQASHVDEALNALMHQGVLTSDGRAYTLAHSGYRNCLIAQLPEAEQAERHRALAAHAARGGKFGLTEVHHALLGGEAQRALDRMAALVVDVSDRTDFWEASGLDGNDIAAVFERAHALAVERGRPPREINELARHLTALSIISDNKLLYAYGTRWAAQLARDSGLEDYMANSAEPDRGVRLQRAVEATLARYAATPEQLRVYRLDEAIKYLARYAMCCVAVGSRGRDTRLMYSTPALLEPFAVLSPVLHALWQNAVSALEMNFLAKPERARERALEVYEALGKLEGDELRYVDMIRNAIAMALGTLEVSLGLPSAMDWIEIMDKDSLQRVNAMYLRRLLAIMDGDTESAERYRRKAEVLAVQSSGRQMFMTPVRQELMVLARTGDLAGLKHVADQIAQVAATEPGWVSQEALAHACYQRSRGDLPAAKQAFERTLALANPELVDPPPCLATWVMAAAGYVGTLVELGELAEARAFGLRALERCAQLEIEAAGYDISRELAIAEAKLGDVAGAAQRIETIIEKRTGILETSRAFDYETRARIAVIARDSEVAVRYAELAAKPYRMNPEAALLSRHGELLQQAHRAGVHMTVQASSFESSILGSVRPAEAHAAETKIATLLRSAKNPMERAARSLQALCDAAHATAGQLYLTRESGFERVACHHMDADGALDEAAGRFLLEQLGDNDATAIVTGEANASELIGSSAWVAPNGAAFRLVALKCNIEEVLVYAGVVALATSSTEVLPSNIWELGRAVSAHLLQLGDATGTLAG